MIRLFTLLSVSLLALATAVAQPASKPAKSSPNTVTVKGPIRLKVELRDGQVHVVASKGDTVQARLTDGTGRAVSIDLARGVARVRVDGESEIASAQLEISVPAKSRVDIETISGRVEVSGIAGHVDIESISGDVQVADATSVDIETVSSDIAATKISGSTSISSVSGRLTLSMTEPATQVELETVSGSIEFAGSCAARCRLDLESLSGDIDLKLDSKRSVFELDFESFSGTMRDALGLSITASEGKQGRGVRSAGFYGKEKSDGTIEVETHSGNLSLKKL